ncbi:Nrm1-like protein [Pleurostoma richardsiae]|uniref:Nrm1-like protein n=1 Tax=Pleurostoma richardsiae TaxID=41990 RepID=A0AA38R5Z7_9PEZI|nr:Nrm1-like protein [Pleurostoma richardsiae]
MSSPLKKQPEAVADKVLRRAELGKMARKLQNRLALAQFKTRHGWEDLTLDTIEPRVEEEIRRKRLQHHDGGDMLSDSSSSASDLPYPSGRALMSSPLKAPFFSDAVGSSNGSTGHRKRTYMASFDQQAALSSPSKRFHASPTSHKSFAGHTSWKDHHQLAQSSPIKPRRQQHFTTSTGPDVSLFQGTRRLAESLTSPNFAAPSDEDEDLLPAHSFQAGHNHRSPPPSTPPMRSRSLNRRNKDKDAGNAAKSGEEGADLLLYLAASPSPANPPLRTRMEPPSTPPPKRMELPSSMMTTPGGGNLFPNTPGQGFDFADFVNITPSPAQKPWKTPIGFGSAKTPLSVARRRLTFEEPPHGLPC